MKVDRCVCHSITFERLKAIADQDALDLEGLRARTRCCSSCRMCEPYIRRMLRTGETVFPLDADNPALLAGDPTDLQGEEERERPGPMGPGLA